MANQPQQPDTALHNASHLMQYHDLIESIVAALDARDAYGGTAPAQVLRQLSELPAIVAAAVQRLGE